jgi:hypothetical protein
VAVVSTKSFVLFKTVSGTDNCLLDVGVFVGVGVGVFPLLLLLLLLVVVVDGVLFVLLLLLLLFVVAAEFATGVVATDDVTDDVSGAMVFEWVGLFDLRYTSIQSILLYCCFNTIVSFFYPFIVVITL